MTIFSTCETCGDIMVVDHDGQRHHVGCDAPAWRTPEEKLQRFAQMVDWITKNEPTPKQLEEFDALRADLDRIEDSPPRLGDAAMLYVSWGWPVFPLRPLEKRPATKHGLNDWTSDPDRVRAYWGRYPDAGIGIPTGHRFDVVDIDVPKGMAWLKEHGEAGLEDLTGGEIHGKVSTASGGLHMLIQPVEGAGNLASIVPGVDYRGTGGYVVAPPSWLGRGKRWEWIVRPSPKLKAIKEAA